VIGGIVAASTLSLETRGVKLIGTVPQGIPPLRIPAVYWNDLTDLLPLALACFSSVRFETAAIGRMFVAKHGGRFDANQENLALAASNLFAWTRWRLSGERWYVAVVCQRRGRCAHTALDRPRCGLHSCGCALFLASFLNALPQPVLAPWSWSR